MADHSKDSLTEIPSGYKQNVGKAAGATLVWQRDLVFTGSTPQGYEIEFDANVQWGCKPTEALLLSLAGCMAIDIMTILTKMRQAVAGFRVEIKGERNAEPPQYYKAVEMVMHLSGKKLEPAKVERAIALSRETYCSVYHSLRPDLTLDVRYILEDHDAGDPAKS